MLYDNPLFPAAVTVLGRTIFPGPRTVQNLLNVTPGQTPWQSFALALHDHSHWYTYDPPNGGLGPVFTILGIPAMVAAGLHALVTRRGWVVAQLVVSMLLLVLQPFKYRAMSCSCPRWAVLALRTCFSGWPGGTPADSSRQRPPG